ncbi:metallophosphoesterase [bacterium]|nr:metallophosphoesterase [bacterium]
MSVLANILGICIVGLLIAVAACGTFVWFYNRMLSRMHESVTKKVVALATLPLGCLAGLVGGCRMVLSTPAGAERWVWLVGLAAGIGLVLRYTRVSLFKRQYARGSRFERPRLPVPSAIDWTGLRPHWKPFLWMLQPVNCVGDLRIHRRVVEVRDLPPEFDGYRIVHLTDMHIHKTLTPQWYDGVIDEAHAWKPDLLLYGGDFISKHPQIPRIPGIMSRLGAPDGVYYVRGNHDFWKAPQRIARLAEQCGMKLLSNQAVVLRRGAAALTLIGVESPYIPMTGTDRDALAQLPRPRIGLVHAPEGYADAAALGCVVALAGHTHGGQVRLPLFGTTVSSTAAGPIAAEGPGRWGDMLTLTSHGQGSFFPLRFLCPPEIIVVDLVPAEG